METSTNVHKYNTIFTFSRLRSCPWLPPLAADGTVIYTPDGTASYDGLWLRDFSYMVEYAGFAIPDQDIVNCIRYAVRHRRADGWMPDRVTTDGLAVYAAGIAAAPVGEANLDNTPF